MADDSNQRDFFISYNQADKDWAVWIAWQLEDAGYTTRVQEWDSVPGANFALEMYRAGDRTIAVLSEDYLAGSYTKAEASAAYARDPEGVRHHLLPVRVRECRPEGFFGPIAYLDVVGLPADEARRRLLDGVRDRLKPSQPPHFPGEDGPNAAPTPSYPGGRPTVTPMVEPAPTLDDTRGSRSSGGSSGREALQALGGLLLLARFVAGLVFAFRAASDGGNSGGGKDAERDSRATVIVFEVDTSVELPPTFQSEAVQTFADALLQFASMGADEIRVYVRLLTQASGSDAAALEQVVIPARGRCVTNLQCAQARLERRKEARRASSKVVSLFPIRGVAEPSQILEGLEAAAQIFEVRGQITGEGQAWLIAATNLKEDPSTDRVLQLRLIGVKTQILLSCQTARSICTHRSTRWQTVLRAAGTKSVRFLSLAEGDLLLTG